jgi:hypothetical protein
MSVHDEIVERAVAARNAVPPRAAGDAFVRSLGTRDLALRSALGSRAVLHRLEIHPFQPSRYAGLSGPRCAICGLEEEQPDDLAPDPREHLADRTSAPGRIRHTDLVFAALDLEDFAGDAASRGAAVDAEDRARLAAMLGAVAALPASAGLSDLGSALRPHFRSNALERRLTIEVLGYAGVLCPSSRPSYRDAFVGLVERESLRPRSGGAKEWQYPVQHWTGLDGVNAEAASFWFAQG